MAGKAAIDIGTNSVKMVIGERGADGISTTDIFPVVTRLGRGVDANGNLDPAAVTRTLAALTAFKAQADESGVTEVYAVGTSALRDAANGAEFIRQATAILNGPVEVISGDREAELVYNAARFEARTLAPTAGTLLTTDVGGGSTEIVIGQGARILFRESLQLGAVRLTEQCFMADPPTEEELTQAVQQVRIALSSLPRPEDNAILIASGGTAANLAAMDYAEAFPNTPLSADVLYGRMVSRSQIRVRIAQLVTRPLAERRKTPGLEPDRADVIIAGALIQAALLRHFQQETMLVSLRGLRYGLLYEMLE